MERAGAGQHLASLTTRHNQTGWCDCAASVGPSCLNGPETASPWSGLPSPPPSSLGSGLPTAGRPSLPEAFRSGSPHTHPLYLGRRLAHFRVHRGDLPACAGSPDLPRRSASSAAPCPSAPQFPAPSPEPCPVVPLLPLLPQDRRLLAVPSSPARSSSAGNPHGHCCTGALTPSMLSLHHALLEICLSGSVQLFACSLPRSAELGCGEGKDNVRIVLTLNSQPLTPGSSAAVSPAFPSSGLSPDVRLSSSPTSGAPSPS